MSLQSRVSAILLLAVSMNAAVAQSLPATPASPATSTAAAKPAAKQPTNSQSRRAAKRFLEASKLFEAEKYEEAMRGYAEAAKLDPTQANYALAMDVARNHAVTALIQAAAKDRLRGDEVAARAALAHGFELDPGNPQLSQHMNQLGDDALLGLPKPIYEEDDSVGGAVELLHTAGTHSFHLRSDQHQIIQAVFKAYGIETTFDESIQNTPLRIDLDDLTFDEAMRILALMTDSFYVPLDAHRVLVAKDTHDLREQYVRQEYETIYLSGLTEAEIAEVGTLAKNLFSVQKSAVEPSRGTITLRAPQMTLNAFNTTLHTLLEGHNQVLLEVRMIQLSHTSTRNTGVQLPQHVTAYNLYAEEQSILNANQALVQQIISSGLAAPGDTMAILAILLASGQVSSSLFANGIALFGGGLTQSALAPGATSVNFALNTSDSRELDQIQLRLGDGEKGTLRVGERYPIQTATYSSMTPSTAGLGGAGNSSSLSALLGQLGGSTPQIPMIQYEDLGLTLTATPKVMRDDDVALTLEMKVDALAGGSLNGNPILSNRSYSGVVTVKREESMVLISELDKQESKAVSGTPGVSEIPGFNDITDKNKQINSSTLVVVITPHVIRGSQVAGHTPMMRVEKNPVNGR